ncbi:hypothetical protein CcI49_33620 [Frankia sp. CcI49]|uniref:hypothetical protein n=1 Tax=Frankia sp. CcI49 TaxID=1745382 RepID=UPI000977590E|nr:hypothetical protein [Frankia sp. CcI49]ONH52476.1 hypothetical protein CcI49_33620 [Frankia sp. CcI49]
MVDQERSIMLRRTEWWLFRQALPKFIAKQGFRSHTLARMFPFLFFVDVVAVEEPFEDFLGADWRVTLAVSVLLSTALWLFVTRIRRRPPPPVPTWLAVILVSAYFLASPLAATAYVVARPEEVEPGDLTLIVTFELVVLTFAFGVANIATRYGLVALFMHALRHVAGDLRNSFGLLGHALPAVLFLTAFLFFTGDIWKLTQNLSRWRLGFLFVLFAAVIVLAIRARLREELDNLVTSMSTPELERACHGTPLEPVAAELAPLTQVTRLKRAEERNILLVLASRQLIRATVVGVGVFLFFGLLGLITITSSTAKSWIGAAPRDLLPGISVETVKVSALLAGFSVMYFAVSSMTDDEYRQRYFNSVLKEISRVLAVRAVYLKLRETTPGPAADDADASRSSDAGTAAA